jgi:hypothetical protein
MVDLTVDAAVVPSVHAPPATTLLQPLQFQIPTLVLFTESFPQKAQVYLELGYYNIDLLLGNFHLFNLLS